MKLRHAWTVPALLGLVLAFAVTTGCGGGGNDPVINPPPGHEQLVLKDRLGNPIQLGSTEPYSPRQTCGACHDINEISNGYHFQQGRTDKFGDIQTADDFFGDGRTFLKSDGMYGKW